MKTLKAFIPSSFTKCATSPLTESSHLMIATVKATSQQALASMSSFQDVTASNKDSPLPGMTKSTTVVVPPANAALEPLVKSSMASLFKLVQVSSPPGMTNLSVASMTLAPKRGWVIKIEMFRMSSLGTYLKELPDLGQLEQFCLPQ